MLIGMTYFSPKCVAPSLLSQRTCTICRYACNQDIICCESEKCWVVNLRILCQKKVFVLHYSYLADAFIQIDL